MRNPNSQLAFLLIFALVILIVLAGRNSRADSPACPPASKSCKVVVITPEEEATLTGPEGVFDHAVWANRAKFSDMIVAWRRKLENAPAGALVENPLVPK